MGNELVPFKGLLPDVVDEEGHSVEGPEMERILKLVTGIAQNAQLAAIRKSLQRRNTQGHKKTLVLNVTDQLRSYDVMAFEPYIPWATLHITNMGPSPVDVAINDYYDYTQLWVNVDLPFDFTEADERINYIAYKCDPGGTATIQLVATY